MVKQRLIREEPPLPDDAVLVRALFDTYPHGGAFDRDVLISDVTYNFDLFGYYGLSLWLVSHAWPLERVSTHGPVYGGTYGSVRVAAGSPQELVDRLLTAAYTVEDNPSYEQDSS